MKGYLNDPDATNAAICDGWLRTKLRNHGPEGVSSLSWTEGMTSSYRGTNIYPREVEETLIKHDKIAEVAVIGRPEKGMGRKGHRLPCKRRQGVVKRHSLNDFVCLRWPASSGRGNTASLIVCPKTATAKY